MKIKKNIASLLFLSSFLLLNTATSRGQDVRAGLAQTGLFHGQVAIGGLKEMIYYLEKTVDADDPDKKFQDTISTALKKAKEAYALFAEAISHSEKGLNLISKKDKK